MMYGTLHLSIIYMFDIIGNEEAVLNIYIII